MTGVVYYNRGTKCLIRLCVSIYSLRRYYDGPVCLMQDGPLPSWMPPILDTWAVRIEYGNDPRPCLVAKAGLWRWMPYDRAMFIDSDTIILGPIDEFLGYVRDNDYVATGCSNWTARVPKIVRRLEAWRPVCPDLIEPAKAYARAINTGVQGWSKVSTLLPAAESLAEKGYEAGCTKIIVDEVACQLLLPQHPHFLASDDWNCSVKYGNLPTARIIHYHGRKHCRDFPACEPWKKAFSEFMAEYDVPQFLKPGKLGDTRLRTYLARRGFSKELCVVTACSEDYAGKFERNLPKWREVFPNLEIIIFVRGFRNRKHRKFMDLPGVRVIRWDFPGSTQREIMLAAFIFGVAREIRTDHWMKLDCDMSPRGPVTPPDYHRASIIARRWSYTRIKGTYEGRHWLNLLDDVFSPQKRLFPDPINGNFFKHRRIISKCAIYRTEFTKRIAKALGGKMVVPSEDTIVSYFSELWKEPVEFFRFQDLFKG